MGVNSEEKKKIPTEKLNAWHKNAGTFKVNPKHLRKGVQVTVYPETEPKECEIDGRWGKRQMYVVETNLGASYISPQQLYAIDTLLMLRGNYTEPLVWVPQ